jgi:chromosome segregation ATPase
MSEIAGPVNCEARREVLGQVLELDQTRAALEEILIRQQSEKRRLDEELRAAEQSLGRTETELESERRRAGELDSEIARLEQENQERLAELRDLGSQVDRERTAERELERAVAAERARLERAGELLVGALGSTLRMRMLVERGLAGQ